MNTPNFYDIMCTMKLIHPKIIIKEDFKISYRLYTDIIVAAKINDSCKRACSFLKDEEKAKRDIYISVDSCLILQRSCKNMCIENLFTNSGNVPNPNRDWDKKIMQHSLIVSHNILQKQMKHIIWLI